MIIKQTTVREIDIEFPYYTSNGYLYCHFINQYEAITISFGHKKQSWSLEKHHCTIPENWIFYPQITEQVFRTKLNECKDIINTL